MTTPVLVPTDGGVPCDCEGYDAPHVCSSKGCYSCFDVCGNEIPGCIQNHRQQRLDQTQKIIQGVVRAPSSLFSMNLAAFNVYDAKVPIGSPANPYGGNHQTQSDRRQRSVVQRSMGTYRGSNSTKFTKTAARPGATNAPGTGVDVKHGSYARYLARKKGTGPLRTQSSANPNCSVSNPRVPSYSVMQNNPSITTGGKNVKFGMISACYCPCSN